MITFWNHQNVDKKAKCAILILLDTCHFAAFQCGAMPMPVLESHLREEKRRDEKYFGMIVPNHFKNSTSMFYLDSFV